MYLYLLWRNCVAVRNGGHHGGAVFESFERENGRVLVFPSSVDGSETRAKLAEIGGTKKSPILGHIKWEQARGHPGPR